MPSVHQTGEIKYVADEEFEIPALTPLLAAATKRARGSAGPAPVAEGEVVRRRSTAIFFDTVDLRLAAAGVTLQRRTGDDAAGWSVGVTGLARTPGVRSEVTLPLGPRSRTEPPKPLRRMVWASSRGGDLVPVAQLDTDRTVRRLLDPTGRAVLEVADDKITVRRLVVREPGTSWRQIEVDLPGVEPEVLARVDDRLRKRGLRPADHVPQLQQLLGLDAGAAGPDGTSRRPPKKRKGKQDAKGKGKNRSREAVTPRLTLKSPAGQVVLAYLREQVEQIRHQDLPVRLDAPDAIHKMRVATRRLRSALATFKPLFDADRVRAMRGELKWLAGELGAARDAEVMRDRLRDAVRAELPERARDGAAAQTDPKHGFAWEDVAAVTDDQLGQAYRRAHDRVLAELDGQRYRSLLLDLDRLVESPPFTPRSDQRAGKVLTRRVASSYRDVRQLVKQVNKEAAGARQEELLHEARKAAKAARYAGESVTSVFGNDAAAFAAGMERVQETLGEHQDSVVTQQRLRDLALHADSTAAAFTYGRLHAHEESHTGDSRRHFDQAWKKAIAPRLHRWLG
jgi:CHAD domain-containing protein